MLTCVCFCVRPATRHHLCCHRRLVRGPGERRAGVWDGRIPWTQGHHLDMVRISSHSLSPLSSSQQCCCAATSLFTCRWNVPQNIHKPPPTRTYRGYTPADNKDVCWDVKEGVSLCFAQFTGQRKASVSRCATLSEEKREGGDAFTRGRESQRHEEEPETHAKHLIIEPCFKYHYNAC